MTRPFCRTTTTKAVVLSSTSTGTGTPDVDELFAVFVTSPTNVVRSRNFIRYQADCKLATSLPDVVASNGFGGPINLTPLFGAECGTFSVRVAVRNGFTPYGWSAVWVV